MPTKIVDLSAFAKENITICLLQIESPFDSILKASWRSNGHVFSPNQQTEKNYAARVERLINILKELQRSSYSLDVVALPEYAFLKNDLAITSDGRDTMSHLTSYAESTKTIVVGNYYDDQERQSTSFAIVPSAQLERQEDTGRATIFYCNKYTRSRFDEQALSNPDSQKTSVIRLEWAAPGNSAQKAYVQILTCKDFLYYTSIKPLREEPEIIILDRPGIIICPVCTPEIATFESRAMALARDADLSHGDMSIITCICNATSLVRTSDISICGQSQVISPYDVKTQLKPIIRKGVEGCVIATINPFRSYRKPTPANMADGGTVLSSSQVLIAATDSDKGLIIVPDGEKRNRTNYLINPQRMIDMGLKKVYGFLRCESYHDFKTRARARNEKYRESSIAIHGVYGIHDILASTWEEFSSDSAAREFIKMRLWPMVRDEERELGNKHLGCCVVKRFWKYRGVRLDNGKDGMTPMEKGRDRSFRELARDVLLGHVPDEAQLIQLTSERVVMRTEIDYSDLSIEEANEGKVEYLILLKLLPLDTGPYWVAARGEFERTTMVRLLDDVRVRTIEELQAEGTAFVDADYMIHIVGDLNDLNDIVINVIHDNHICAGEPLRFSCGTRVVLPAESISFDRYPSLIEQNKQPSTEPNIIALINSWKKIDMASNHRAHILLSVIYLVDEESIRRLLQAYFLADAFSSQHRKEPTWMHEYFSFAYGICCWIANADASEGAKSSWIDFCAPFITHLGREVEGAIGRVITRIIEDGKITREQFDKYANLAISALTKRAGNFDSLSIEIGTCALAFEKMNAALTKENYLERIKEEIAKNSDIAAPSDDFAKIEEVLRTNIKKIVITSDILREMNEFARIRNAASHFREEGHIDSNKFLEGSFYGLRILDRCEQFLSSH